MPDETKLAITDCASRGSARSRIFGAVGHCSLLLVLSSLFVDHPFSASRFISLCAFPTHATYDDHDQQLN
jgi:hypothetical protein